MNALIRRASLALMVGLLFFAHVGWGQVDGSLDLSFDPGTGFNGIVYTTCLQNDGKIVAGGSFTSFNGMLRNNIARLKNDGGIDTTFQIGLGFNALVACLAIQPDGKILVGGNFTAYNGTHSNYLIRINSNGVIDTSFAIRGSGLNDRPDAIKVQQDGRIIIGGAFTSLGGVPYGGIARLNIDGSVDTSFHSGTGFSSGVLDIEFDSNQKIVVAGSFQSFDGVNRKYIARLDQNGALDTSFKIKGTGFGDHLVHVIIQPNNKIVATGYFSRINSAPYKYIVRLKDNGDIDSSFQLGIGFNAYPWVANCQQNGSLVIGGSFTQFQSYGCHSISRLKENGDYDTSFHSGLGFDGTVLNIKVQPDNKILAGGAFNHYNGIARNSIIRLNNTGLNQSTHEQVLKLTLSPNPTHQTATLTTTEPIQSIRLLSANGQSVRALPGGAGTITLDLAGLSPGLYLVEAVTEKGAVQRARLAVE